jgi:hypothetical protein
VNIAGSGVILFSLGAARARRRHGFFQPCFLVTSVVDFAPFLPRGVASRKISNGKGEMHTNNFSPVLLFLFSVYNRTLFMFLLLSLDHFPNIEVYG